MKIAQYKGTHRMARVSEGTYFNKGKYIVSFYYDGYPDYEWKRGSHGIACTICDTLAQAKRISKYYIQKDNE